MDLNRRIYVRKANQALLLCLLLSQIRKNKSKPNERNNQTKPKCTMRPRRYWVREIYKQRKSQGAFNNLIREMKEHDVQKYFNYLRMHPCTFQKLFSLVGPALAKTYCIPEPISPEERLAITLRYLGSGDSMMSISYAFRVAHNTVSKIIKEACDAIWDYLSQDQLLTPSEEAWLNIAEGFGERWQLPHCVGAIDGKHVVMQAPSKSGSTFFNYKGSHSIVLLALCDASYRFTLVDIGAEGRHSDGGIFKNSNMGKLINTNNINFPQPSLLGQGDTPFNFYIVGDEAFPLTTSIMRPYPGHFLPRDKRIFNYRLSRGRRVIENAFGILASRWRIYRRTIIASESTVVGIVKATVCLHNFMMNNGEKLGHEHKYIVASTVDHENEAGELVHGDWRSEHGNNLVPIGTVQVRQSDPYFYALYYYSHF